MLRTKAKIKTKIKTWDKRQITYLKKHYRKMTAAELAEKFGLSPSSIRSKEKALGLVRKHPARTRKKPLKKVIASARKWTKSEELYVGKYYLKKTNAQLAKKFKTTPKSVEKKLYRMGLKRRIGATRLSHEEKQRRIEAFLLERHPKIIDQTAIQQRKEAIAQYEKAMKFYYKEEFETAEEAFKNITENFADTRDVVYKAKQYIGFCKRKK